MLQPLFVAGWGLCLLGALDGGNPEQRAHLREYRAVSGCPDEAELRSSVDARLGRIAWDRAAPRQLVVHITRNQNDWSATVLLLEATGASLGQRDLHAVSRDCRDIFDSTVFAMAMVIEPPDFPVAQAEPLKERPPLPEPPALPKEVSAPPPMPSPDPPLDIRFGVGGHLVLGSVPGLSGGAGVMGELRISLVALGLGMRSDIQRSTDVSGGRVVGSAWTSFFAPCVHYGWVMVCSTIGVTLFRGEGIDLVDASDGTAWVPEVGARLGVELPLTEVFSGRVVVASQVPLSRVSLVDTVTDAVYWERPPLAGTLELGLVTRIP